MTNTKQEEVWKTYPEFDFIEVSNLGRVRTKDRYVKVKGRGKRLIKGRALKQQLLPNCYLKVNFRVNGKFINLYVHRMVAITFIPNPDNYPEVNHIDNDPTNNRADNIEWCTHEYNMSYKEKYGKSARDATKVLRKSVIAVNLNNFKVLWFESRTDTAHQLGFYQWDIGNVIKGKQNKTHGYWFCYVDENTVEKIRAKFGDKVAHEVEKLIGENYD